MKRFSESVIIAVIVLLVNGLGSDGQLIQANWTPCKYENGSVIPTESEDVRVYVSNCTRDEEVCNFVRGTSALLNITFKAKTSAAEIERGVLAKMWMPALGKYINVPYGNLWNPCESMRDLNSTEANCLTTGIQANHFYNSQSEFKVNEDFPQVSNIAVKILFRAKSSNPRVRSLRKWNKHPGPLFLCVELANCAVV